MEHGNWCKFSPMRCLEGFSSSGSLSFSRSNLILVGPYIFIFFTVASDVSSWDLRFFSNVHTSLQAPLNHDAINLVMVFSIWVAPYRSLEYFGFTNCIYKHEIVLVSKFEKPVHIHRLPLCCNATQGCVRLC